MGEQHLLSAHVQESGAVAETIEVQRVQASGPMIWRARVLKDCAPESVTLVPWTATLLRIVENKEETTDGVLLESIKRPKDLFGGLPLLATMSVACPSSGDLEVLAARSPLAGKFSNERSPPAFWCVLEAGEGDEARVNMEVRFAEMTFSTATIQVQGVRPKKKMKPLNLVFTFPVLVNSKLLHKDDILVFPRKSTFQIPSPADEDEGAEEAPSAMICQKWLSDLSLTFRISFVCT